MTDRPKRWEPHPAARARAESNAKMLDVDLNIDRYIGRCKDRGTTPSDSEWLRWFLDDEQKARIEDRRARDPRVQETDDIGVPLTWRKP